MSLLCLLCCFGLSDGSLLEKGCYNTGHQFLEFLSLFLTPNAALRLSSARRVLRKELLVSVRR